MGSNPNVLTGSPVGLNQKEPAEGRKMILFPPLFAGQKYSWNQKSLGNQPVSSIQSCWIDLTNLVYDPLAVPFGASFLLQVGAPNQSGFALRLNQPKVNLTSAGAVSSFVNGAAPGDGEPQGFYLLPSQVPFEMLITVGSGTLIPQPSGTNYAKIILFNYNVFLTGIFDAAEQVKNAVKHFTGGKKLNTGAAKS